MSITSVIKALHGPQGLYKVLVGLPRPLRALKGPAGAPQGPMEKSSASAPFGPKMHREPFSVSPPLPALDIPEHLQAGMPAGQEFEVVLTKLAAVHADAVWQLKNEIQDLKNKLELHDDDDDDDDVPAREDPLELEEQVPVLPANMHKEEEEHTVLRPTEVGGLQKAFTLKDKLQMDAIDESSGNVRNTAHRLSASKHSVRNQLELRKASSKNTLYHMDGKGNTNYRVTCQDWSLTCIVDHPLFNVLGGFIIVINSVVMGVEVELLTGMAQSPLALIIVNEACSQYFLFELVLRVFAQRSVFFRGEGRGWNFFDTALVLLSVVDTLGQLFFRSSALKVMQAFKPLKMLRIARLFRAVRFFGQLYLLVSMIIDSLKQLLWATVLLMIVMYVFAVVLTGNCSEFLQSQSVQETDNQNLAVASEALREPSVGPSAPLRGDEIQAYYGHLHLTVYTLFQTLLGGVSWREVCNPLFHVGVFSPMLFLAYVTFVMVAVLNIITGVFVDNAMTSAKMERNYLVEKELEEKESYVHQLKKFFSALDLDGDGDIEIQEVVAILDDPSLAAYLVVLGIEVHDAERLFRLFDAD